MNSALAAAHISRDKANKDINHQSGHHDLGWQAMRLSGFLAAASIRNPEQIAFSDQEGRNEWSSRPVLSWSHRFAQAAVERLTAFFESLELPSHARVGILLPNGSEACLTFLAIERAGLIPCLLPLDWTTDQLIQACEQVQVQVLVSQSRIDRLEFSEITRQIAARYYGIRFLCAYGPSVPDGVFDLDRIISDTTPLENPSSTFAITSSVDLGFITFLQTEVGIKALFRSSPSAVAAAMTFLISTRMTTGDHILNLLAPDDHAGITTGLIASLLSGATLETMGLFNAKTFLEALEADRPLHIVAPGWMEEMLIDVSGLEKAASIVLVHKVPVRFRARQRLMLPVIDVLSFDDMALLSAPRDAKGRFALSLEETEPVYVSTRNLLRIRRDGDDNLFFSGLACDTREWKHDGDHELFEKVEWQHSGYKADLFAGRVVSIEKA